MKYIITEKLNANVLPEQKDELKRIQSEIFSEYGINFPISELVRLALDQGIPVIDEDRSFVSKHLNQQVGEPSIRG